jgi:hypothetical protein
MSPFLKPTGVGKWRRSIAARSMRLSTGDLDPVPLAEKEERLTLARGKHRPERFALPRLKNSLEGRLQQHGFLRLTP